MLWAEGQNAEANGRATYQLACSRNSKEASAPGVGMERGRVAKSEVSWRQDHGLGRSLAIKLGLEG